MRKPSSHTFVPLLINNRLIYLQGTRQNTLILHEIFASLPTFDNFWLFYACVRFLQCVRIWPVEDEEIPFR